MRERFKLRASADYCHNHRRRKQRSSLLHSAYEPYPRRCYGKRCKREREEACGGFAEIDDHLSVRYQQVDRTSFNGLYLPNADNTTLQAPAYVDVDDGFTNSNSYFDQRNFRASTSSSFLSCASADSEWLVLTHVVHAHDLQTGNL